jgi:hypothetical protein
VMRPGVSEVIGTLILIGVVVLGIIIMNVVIFSHPPPARIPSFEGTIINTSKLITITHQGGDTLEAGQYKILVDGVDRTGNFTNSRGTGPFSAGETLSWNALAMPHSHTHRSARPALPTPHHHLDKRTCLWKCNQLHPVHRQFDWRQHRRILLGLQ